MSYDRHTPRGSVLSMAIRDSTFDDGGGLAMGLRLWSTSTAELFINSNQDSVGSQPNWLHFFLVVYRVA